MMNENENSPTSTPSVYPRSYIVGFIVGIIVLVLTSLIALQHELSGLQARIFYDFNNLTDIFRLPALFITGAFGSLYPIILCVLIPLFFKRYKLAWRFFFTIAGTGVAMEIVKIIVKEPRPAALLHGHLHQRAIETGLNSFPSGHEAVATAMALTLWLLLPKTWRWLAILWIVLVGVSRIYLGVHTLNDVMGGFAVGLLIVSVVRLLPPKLAHRLHLETKDILQKHSS